MIIFRENTEDIYAGIEYAAARPRPQKFGFIAKEFPKDFKKISFRNKPAAESFGKRSVQIIFRMT